MEKCRFMTRYSKLISYYKATVVEGYVEKHHIIPKCQGGTDDFDNLVALPPRVHYLAHYFLWKAYPQDNRLSHAFSMMSVNNKHQHRVMNAKLYELSKIARSNALKGKPRSEETKAKMRKPKTLEHKIKLLGNTNASGGKGKKHLKQRTLEHTKNQVKSRSWYDDQRKKETALLIEKYRQEFMSSNLTRKQFAELHNISYVTVKRYLRGL